MPTTNDEHEASDSDYLWFLFNEQGYLISGPRRTRPLIEPGHTATGIFINRIVTTAKPVL